MCAPRASASTSSGWAYSRSIRSRTRRRRARSRRRSASPGLVVTTAMVPCPPRTRRSLHRRTRTLGPCRCPARSGRPPVLHPYLDGPYPRAYAHRGWHLDELAGLENTTAAFRRAVDEGYSYLELDVHATADGVAVVHHDRALDRTTDATGPLAARTAAELARVRVRGAAPARADPAPARRARRAARHPGHRRAEVQCGGPARAARAGRARRLGPRVPRRLPRPVAAGGPPARPGERRAAVHLDGPHRGRRAAGARLDPAGDGPRPAGGAPAAGAGPDGSPRRCAATWPSSPTGSPGSRSSTPTCCGSRHESGREVHVWTVDDPAVMGGLLDRGADGILTDRPDLLRDLLRARGPVLAAGSRRPADRSRPRHPRAGARLGPVGLGLGGLQHR